MRYYLTTMSSVSRNNINSYLIYQKITETMVDFDPKVSTHYLYYLIKTSKVFVKAHTKCFLDEKLPQIFEEDYFKLFNDKLGIGHFSQDIVNLYCLLSYDDFVEILHAVIFSNRVF